MNAILVIMKKTEPDYYQWIWKWNTALKNERVAKEKRLKKRESKPHLIKENGIMH